MSLDKENLKRNYQRETKITGGNRPSADRKRNSSLIHEEFPLITVSKKFSIDSFSAPHASPSFNKNGLAPFLN